MDPDAPATPDQNADQTGVTRKAACLAVQSLYASCSIVEKLASNMNARYQEFALTADQEYEDWKKLLDQGRYKDVLLSLDLRSERYDNALMKLQEEGYDACVESLRFVHTNKVNLDRLAEQAADLESAVFCAEPNGEANEVDMGTTSRKRPYSVLSNRNDWNMTPSFTSCVKTHFDRDSIRRACTQSLAQLKMTPKIATAVSLFRNELEAAQNGKAENAAIKKLVKDVPRLSNDEPLGRRSSTGVFIETDPRNVNASYDSAQSSQPDEDDDDRDDDEEDGIDDGTSVLDQDHQHHLHHHHLHHHHDDNDDDDDDDDEEDDEDDEENEEEDENNEVIDFDDEEANSLLNDTEDDQGLHCPHRAEEDELREEEELLLHDAEDDLDSNLLSMPVTEEEEEEEEEENEPPMQTGVKTTPLKPPSVLLQAPPAAEQQCPPTQSRLQMFKSPLIRIQEKLGLGSFHKQSQQVIQSHQTPNNASCVRVEHRLLRVLPPKNLTDNMTFFGGELSSQDPGYVPEWGQRRNYFNIVEKQKRWNPYTIFGCGVRVVQFDDVFRTPDFRRAAHLAASAIRRQPMSITREKRISRWNSDKINCGFNDNEGMTASQLERMVSLLGKTVDLSDAAYQSRWYPCDESCNHNIQQKQPWFRVVRE